MCGIVGYVGSRKTIDFLLEGLRRLEYRGYDSAGVATITADRRIVLAKAVGRIENLAAIVAETDLQGAIGIGHTRWATHGAATPGNAHPHVGGNQSLALVHNGVIENYQSLRAALEAEGYRFRSETDSEVIAHLVSSMVDKQLVQLQGRKAAPRDILIPAVRAALGQLRGTYGLVIAFRDYPDCLVAARLGSPLVIGIGTGEHFVGSDASTLVGYTEKIVYMADHQVAFITADRLHLTHREQGQIQPSIETLDAASDRVTTDGYRHFMLKEIFEQPDTIQNAMRGRLSDDDATAVFGGLNLIPQQLRNINRIILTACGTSWHAGLYGEYLIEELARIPVEVEYASELRYRNPPVDPHTLVFALSQSGETADTLGALREMKRKGHSTLAICNVVGSSIAQEADGGVFLHAGPEIGVASTKAFTSQCVVLALLGLYFGRLRHVSYEAGRRIIDAMRALPDHVRATLALNDQVKAIAEKYCEFQNFLYLGRHYNFPTALEGALKLKEISYIHAEGYPAAEMKHGPIALVDARTPSVFLVPRGWVYEKVLSNLQEVKARGGPVIAICAEDDAEVTRLADDVLHVPMIDDCFQPIVSVIPLQLLAYHIAVLRGCDVDKPRNLAKSVTVE
ncbi:MAG: glutamine--fructose-6-phosphate transaminase (isomerizing) [Planctomycetes bacterium]|nr:glutamine--fructose-6-phosphate transaminase (isomerizing) [Planctomycetota bacterium]